MAKTQQKSVNVIHKNEGTKIAWEQNEYKLTFGDDELSVRCDKYQKDWPVHLDICADKDKNLVIGVGVGRYYIAQIDIPAIEYEEEEVEEEGEIHVKRTPIPLAMENVDLTLWSIDDLEPTPEPETQEE